MSKLNSSNLELDLDRPNIEDYLPTDSIQEPLGKLRLHDLLDISPTLTEAVGAIVDDSFTRCFKSNPPEPWNWNVYLFPLWCLGVVVRYGILFPVRVLILTLGWILFLSSYIPVHLLLKGHDKLRKKLERALVELICSFFVASWTGVVKYQGPRPCARPKQVFVANHTSMIDFIILEQMTAFAVIMQKHPGWVGLLQSTILESVGCIWFNRSEAKDREIVARKLREHVEGADNNPLLIFPEGTCVNNHYTVMFKKGAFELGSTVCPIAIKYNKIFVDAFWNSRKKALHRYGELFLLTCTLHVQVVGASLEWNLEILGLNPTLVGYLVTTNVDEWVTVVQPPPPHSLFLNKNLHSVNCFADAFWAPILQTILHNTSIAAHDIMGCGVRCLVSRTPKYEARRNTY